MTKTIDFSTKRRRPVAVVAGVILAATFACVALSGSASAEDRGRDHHDWHHRDSHRGYYGAPPVVYGEPYYAPPVVYGPGLSINIR